MDEAKLRMKPDGCLIKADTFEPESWKVLDDPFPEWGEEINTDQVVDSIQVEELDDNNDDIDDIDDIDDNDDDVVDNADAVDDVMTKKDDVDDVDDVVGRRQRCCR